MTTSNEEALARLARHSEPLHPPIYHPPAKPGDGGYWRRLLFAAGVCLIIAGILLNAYFNSGDFETPRNGALLGWSITFGTVGQVLLLPGVIGWGIDASGLTKRR